MICVRCKTLFFLCRRCDRGQCYCGSDRRHEARTLHVRAARRRHQQSPEGRADHRDRNLDYRRRKAARVMDQGTATEPPAPILSTPTTEVVEVTTLDPAGMENSHEQPLADTPAAVPNPPSPDPGPDPDPDPDPSPDSGPDSAPAPDESPRCAHCGCRSPYVRNESWTGYRRARDRRSG